MDRCRVRWAAQTVDNEFMGKYKSKCCCIYKKPKKWNEDSDDDSDSVCFVTAFRIFTGRRGNSILMGRHTFVNRISRPGCAGRKSSAGNNRAQRKREIKLSCYYHVPLRGNRCGLLSPIQRWGRGGGGKWTREWRNGPGWLTLECDYIWKFRAQVASKVESGERVAFTYGRKSFWAHFFLARKNLLGPFQMANVRQH